MNRVSVSIEFYVALLTVCVCVCVANDQNYFQIEICMCNTIHIFPNWFHSLSLVHFASIEIFMCVLKQSKRKRLAKKGEKIRTGERGRRIVESLRFKYEVRARIVNGRIMQSVLPEKP